MTVHPTARRLAVLVLAGALAACGGSGGGDEPAAAPVAASGPPEAQQATVVGTQGLDYEPAAVTAVPGSLTLTLEVDDGPPHDLVFDDAQLPAIAAVSAGEQASATYVFDIAGTYDFTCTFHPGMDGQVVVA